MGRFTGVTPEQQRALAKLVREVEHLFPFQVTTTLVICDAEGADDPKVMRSAYLLSNDSELDEVAHVILSRPDRSNGAVRSLDG